MIARRRILILAGCAPLFAALRAGAQAQARLPRVGFFSAASKSSNADAEEGFLAGLRELGYVEGRNIRLERRYGEGDLKRLPALAAELAALKVDVILVTAPPAALAARAATTAIPIVFTTVADPVGNGLAKSLSRPGGNATGLSTLNVELAAKRLELLKETLPKAARVALFYDPNVQENIAYRDATLDSVRKLGIQLFAVPIQRPEEFPGAFAAAVKNRADALLVVASPLLFTNRTRITELALQVHLPTMFNRHEFVEDGGLMTYSVDNVDLYRRAAGYVDKILKGANPADLPIQQPVRFLHIINLKTARALGVTIPQSILLRADRVIE